MRAFLLCLTFVLSWAIPAQSQRSVPAWPANLDTIRYPIIHKVEPMSAIRMAELGLRPVRLDTAIVVWNWTEPRRRFLTDTLQKGVIVAVDSAGRPIYKVDCSNRLTLLVTERLIPNFLGQSAPDSIQEPVTLTPRRGFWASLGDSIRSGARGVWNFLGALLRPLLWLVAALVGLSLLLLLIALALWLLWRFLEWLFGLFQNRPAAGSASGTSTRAASASTPGTSTTTGAATAATSAPAPAPVGAVNTEETSPAASARVSPSTSAVERRFVAYYLGEEHMLRFAGVRDVRFEEVGGVTTLRFRNA